jgi:hypothetical protein
VIPQAPDYVAALDLGSTQDYSALVVLQRRWEAVRGTGNVLPHFLVRYIRRWPLLTSYVQVVADTVAVVRTPPLRHPPLAVDQTGVGKAVVDMLREANPSAVLHPVVITAGHNTLTGQDGSLHVPKKELVSCLQVALQSRRLKIAAVPERELLAKELAAFRVKITASANEEFSSWRERDHDDLVLAVALGVLVGSLPVPHPAAAGGARLAQAAARLMPSEARGLPPPDAY